MLETKQGTLPFSRGCYKAPFSAAAVASDDFTEIRIPFTSFSDIWSPATGEILTTCEEDADACLSDASKLGAIQAIEVWAEGVAGDQHLEIESIIFSMRLWSFLNRTDYVCQLSAASNVRLVASLASRLPGL